MAPLERLRRWGQGGDDTAAVAGYGVDDRAAEEALRARLADDPNDTEAFDQLADLVRRHAAEGHETPEGDDVQRAVNDAVWALAEEIAQNQRAWYPLIELARLSIDDDREIALRRLATAADRDPEGVALTQGLLMLREAGHPDDALGLGVGHWRPREHDPEAGRQLVEAALETGRHGEARRHLEAMAAHPDTDRVQRLVQELERSIARAERTGVVDVRESGGSRWNFLKPRQ